jgi:chromate transporter
MARPDALVANAVGVIVNLAVFFAEHVLWLTRIGEPTTVAALTGIGAFVALVRFKVGIIQLVLACGAPGRCCASPGCSDQTA